LSEEFRQFRAVKSKHGVESIVKAQEYIRARVYEKVSSLTREVLEATCRITNFECFYSYFAWFLTLMKRGETGKRMTKQEVMTLTQGAV
jgi:hypothetical protein